MYTMESLQRLGLFPFFKCVCVYFICSSWKSEEDAGGFLQRAGASVMQVGAKCAPVMCLLLVVMWSKGCIVGNRYASRICTGLAFSMLGDALLVFPPCFLPGMCAFGIAHVAYIGAFGMRPRAFAYGACVFAVGVLFALTLLQPPAELRIPVLVYTVLLSGSAWRGGAEWCSGRPSSRAKATAAGSALFMISDGFLGYSMFNAPLPNHQWLVMSTYYAAQLGIAVSALEPPELTT